jgi:hypothetical protein
MVKILLASHVKEAFELQHKPSLNKPVQIYNQNNAIFFQASH